MDIGTIAEFYAWAQGPFIEGMLPAYTYDGSAVTEEQSRLMTYNKVVGGVRLRQSRVRGDSCEIVAAVQEVFTPSRGITAGVERHRSLVPLDQCYSTYTEATQSREDYGDSAASGGTTADTASARLSKAFRWRSAADNDLAGYTRQGQFGRYDGAGYVLDFVNLTTTSVVETLQLLKQHRWLDRGTPSHSSNQSTGLGVIRALPHVSRLRPHAPGEVLPLV